MAKKKSVSVFVYALPDHLIPEGAELSDGQFPHVRNPLPATVTRSNPNPDLGAIFKWYTGNIEHAPGGLLTASLALPALSLNEALWHEACKLLEKTLADYDEVEGCVFVPSHIGQTRTSLFEVADWYSKLNDASRIVRVVEWRQKRDIAETETVEVPSGELAAQPLRPVGPEEPPEPQEDRGAED